MSQLAEELKRAADQFTCHSASQSIDQVEAAAELMHRAAWVIKAAIAYAASHQERLAAEEAYKWADASDALAESALSAAQAQEKGAHWQLLHECGRAVDVGPEVQSEVNVKDVQAVFGKLVEQDIDAAVVFITGMFVGLIVEYARRRQGVEPGEIKIDGVDARDITIHAPKLPTNQRANVQSSGEGGDFKQGDGCSAAVSGQAEQG